MKSSLWVLMMLVLAGGCAAPEVEQAADESPVEAVELDDAAWTAALIEHRQEIDEEFRTSKESPMAGTQYLKSEPGDEVYLALQDGVFELADAAGPGAQIGATKKQRTWHGRDWPRMLPAPWTERTWRMARRSRGRGLRHRDFHLRFYPSEDRVTFIVFDPERLEMPRSSTSSTSHRTESARRCQAGRASRPGEDRDSDHPEPDQDLLPYAAIEFEVDGEKQQLTALKSELTGDGSEGLFIAFRDATTGRETYGAGDTCRSKTRRARFRARLQSGLQPTLQLLGRLQLHPPTPRESPGSSHPRRREDRTRTEGLRQPAPLPAGQFVGPWRLKQPSLAPAELWAAVGGITASLPRLPQGLRRVPERTAGTNEGNRGFTRILHDAASRSRGKRLFDLALALGGAPEAPLPVVEERRARTA